MNSRRLAAFAVLLVIAAAGCDSSGPSEEDPPRLQATISAKLIEHPYRQAGDSSLAARLSGSAPVIQLDSAFTREVVPTRATETRVEGFGFDRVFIFEMEQCEGADEVAASVTVLLRRCRTSALIDKRIGAGKREHAALLPPVPTTRQNVCDARLRHRRLWR